MEWAWAIPVVAVVIWVLSNLARGADAKKAAQQPRPGGGGRPRSSGADIDRFLEEINRRRQAQQRQREEAPTVQPAAEPVRPQPKRQPAPPRPRPAPPVRSKRPIAESASLAPFLATEAVIADVLPVPPIQASSLLGQVPSQTLAPPSPSSGTKAGAPLTVLRELLHSGQGLKTAVILNEILGRPRCRR